MDLPYDRLLEVIDAYIDEFGGGMRIRGLQTHLLLRRATLDDSGLSISEAHRRTGAPLENLRRHFRQQVEKGVLSAAADPDDERVTRYRVTNLDAQMQSVRRLAERLNAIGRLDGKPVTESAPLGLATIDAQLGLLQVLADALDSSFRIRGFKVAILIQQATLTGDGITAAEISRASGAPLETSRRNLHQYQAAGDLLIEKDPNDERATRVRYPDPAQRALAISAMIEAMNRVDWRAFNLSD